MKEYFVKTTDAETAKMLREAGLVELEKDGPRWVFINDPSKMNFSQVDAKVSFDNKLNF